MAMLRPADEMKDSGIEWVGQIPNTWSVKKARWLFTERNSKGNPVSVQLLTPSQKYGVLPQELYQEVSGTKPVQVGEDKDLSEFKTVRRGDFCISLSAYMGGFEYSDYDGVISPAYHSFYKISDDINNAYYRHLFKSSAFIDVVNLITPQSVRVGRNTSFENFKEVVLPIPPLAEQQAIADYLDDRCSKIDEIIAEATASIEEYKELKQAVIFEAVTKGLDKNVPMKDSGVEWIGKTPKHWGVPKISYLANVRSGGTPSRGHSEFWDGDISWVKTGELQNNYLYNTEECITELGLKNSSAIVFPKDTILVAMYGQGKTRGMTAVLMKPMATNQACAGIIVKSKHIQYDYLWWVLQGAYNGIREKAVGSGQPNLNLELVSHFNVTMPSIQEQNEIVAFLTKTVPEYDDLITEKQALIDDLQAYKKSLIYEVVTGKRRVV